MFTTLIPLLPLLPTLTSAISLDCNKVIDSKITWDLSSLGGPHTVHHLERITPFSETYYNYTYTIDICTSLSSDMPSGCSSGTRICSSKRPFLDLEHGYDPKNPDEAKLPPIEASFPIAGEFSVHGHGSPLDPYIKRLKNSESEADSKIEGVRVTLNGGLKEASDGNPKTKQKALVTFICDKERSGNEMAGYTSEREPAAARLSGAKRAEDDGKGDGGDKEGDGDNEGDGEKEPLPDLENPDEGASLQFKSYKVENEVGTLRLDWRTKFACEDAPPPEAEDRPKSRSSGWGFFTWFIIILFLAIAAYLIFGSWLNYNRYGARGWDLLPHGDTIRDVPYLMKDWARRVFSGGSFSSSRDLGYIRV